MFGWKRRRRTAEREALRTEIKAEVLAEVRELLSLSRVSADGVPNLSELNVALRNIDAANLNLKFFGYELGRKLAKALPPPTGTSARHVGLRCKASIQDDMESDWVAHWCGQLLTPVLFHRKLWELAFVLQAIYEEGHMRAGARGLGFGCGQEPVPSYLASHGVAVTITDLDAAEAQAAGWARTHQHAASLDQAFQPRMIDRAEFDRLVDLRFVDMNAIPDDLVEYDFCWSICALEHLGSIERGLAFVENSLATIRPGGLSVHTTEFNIDPRSATIDNWPAVLFKREHLDALAQRLRSKGHYVAALDFDIGDKPMDRFIDLPPWGHDLPAEFSRWHGEGDHLKVAIDGFISTCFGLIVRKAG
jgi:2-polyprenyl-3-methyl-5-hydroxy-6-metoxy-1,4-benzoquinol methylase